jgi:hypothetical protein
MDVAAVAAVRSDAAYNPTRGPNSQDLGRAFAAPAPDTSAASDQDEQVHPPADPSARGFWRLSDLHAVSELMRQRSDARAAMRRDHGAEQATAAAAAAAKSAEKAAPAVTAVQASQLAAWRKSTTPARNAPARKEPGHPAEAGSGDLPEHPNLPRYL